MNDGMLLQLNRQRNLIPEDRLKAALSIQEKERAAGKTPRPLLDILTTRGDLDSTTVRLIRTLGHREITATLPPPGNGDQDATLVEGFHAVVESVLMPAPEPSPGASKSGWPKEVIEAEADLKNLFGQFVLVAQVGSGGSGTVYRAWDRRVSRYSGLKILHTMEPSALERFTREARIAGNLQHPSIATIYEVGEQDGRYYIAMKYIDGKPIDADPRSIPECLALIRDACRALEYAHLQGIIHRDIKPANLLVDSQDRVYVTDFGIAKQAAVEHTSTLSMTGTIIGTPKYLPPEQARGEAKRADARSDVYSVGATLYTLLAGRAPFPSSNVWETLESVMKREPPPLMSLNGAVSPELERIVKKAMSKEPSHRYASARELAEELDRILEQRRYTGRYGLIRYLARKWMFVAAAGVLIGGFIHWKADAFFPDEDPGDRARAARLHPTNRYIAAATQLLTAQRNYEYGDKKNEERARTMKDRVIDPIQGLLNGDPKNIQARVLLARADHLCGDPAAAEQKLSGLEPQTDYRINFLRGLMKLEAHLLAHPAPLPHPEAPRFQFDPEPKRAGLADYFQVPAQDTALLHEEQKVDRDSSYGLIDFSNGSWEAAVEKLEKAPPLPAFRKALHRATYLNRQWAKVRSQKNESWHGTAPCRECLGAGLAEAFEEDRPLELLERVLDLCAGDPATELTVRAFTARRLVERGMDPTPAVTAGRKLAAEGKGELLGVLGVANLRWKALTGSDSEEEYGKAQAELDAPATWMGKLARVECRLSLGRRRKLMGEDYRPVLEEAIKLANGLGNGEWEMPRVLRAEAYLGLGHYDKTILELPGMGPKASDIRANLLAAEAHLRSRHYKEAQVYAKAAYEGFRDNPQARCLWGAGLLMEAQQDPDPAGNALKAVDHLTIALKTIPGFLEAGFYRAGALLLVADWAPMSPAHAASCRLKAIADLDAVLVKVPKLAEARALREHLTEHLNGTRKTTDGVKK